MVNSSSNVFATHPSASRNSGKRSFGAFWDLTNRQDWTLCENTQRGVASLTWQPGPYSELESQLAAFDREYRRVMALDAASGD